MTIKRNFLIEKGFLGIQMNQMLSDTTKNLEESLRNTKKIIDSAYSSMSRLNAARTTLFQLSELLNLMTKKYVSAFSIPEDCSNDI